jgi:hypothetical protein
MIHLLVAICLVGCVSLHRRHCERIMGTDSIEASQMERFLLRHNPNIDHCYARHLISTYQQECHFEGVRVSVAFCQMCLETGFLTFPGMVSIEQNNFCGYGVTDNNTVGEKFPSMRTGIRVHVQHLKSYGSSESTNRKCIDSRRRYVSLGSAPAVMDLAGRWATDPEYGTKLCNLITRLRAE